ncbi:MAG: BatA domain-containing protein [Pirellulaceae bacterium]|nr:BatA domain-containing protein [Pirellulaceae bacterium]
MIFLNALLIAGTAAASIPLIIHLLNRSRFKVLDWGAMHLLESALKINSRRIQWQAWLLLLLRMLIPAILALCLARPVLTAWRTAAGGNQHSVVLVIDNSLSMEAAAAKAPEGTTEGNAGRNVERTAAGNAGGSTSSCFAAAIAEATALIQRFGPSTEITLLTSGGGVVDQTSGATFDTQRVLRRLRDVRGGAGASALRDALSTGLASLAKAKQPRRHLILISDFQRSQWEGIEPESLTTLRASSESKASPIEVTFIPVMARSPDNLSVQIDRPLGPSVVTPKQTLEVRVAVRNHGRQRVKNLPVVLTADKVQLASKNVEIAGDSQVFLAFSCQLQTLGSHVLSVSIDERAARIASGESPQALVSSDDVSRWSVEVIEPVRVGIVSTRAANSKLIDESTFLNLALSPYAVSLDGASTNEETAGWAEAQAGADPIECEIVGPQDLSEKWLATRQAIILTNIPTLDDATAQRVTQFVQAGGLLIIWAGDALQSQWYNQRWGTAAAVRLLPADFAELSRPVGRPQATLKIQNQSYEHPALTFFNRSSNGRLDSIDFNTWYRLQADSKTNPSNASPKKTDTEQAALTMLVLDNGDPLLMERAVGRGRVMQWATSCGERWSNLPLREVFVPLVQQLVLYGATSSMPQLNIEAGGMLAVALSSTALPPADPKANQAADKSNSDKSKANTDKFNSDKSKLLPAEIELLTPQNLRYRLDVQSLGESRSVQFASTNFPGAYQLSGVQERPIAIVAGVRAEESVLTPLDQGELNDWAKRLDAQVQPSASAFWQAEQVKQTGREIWRYMLAALVVCLLAELLLQQSLTRTPT